MAHKIFTRQRLQQQKEKNERRVDTATKYLDVGAHTRGDISYNSCHPSMYSPKGLTFIMGPISCLLHLEKNFFKGGQRNSCDATNTNHALDV